MRDAQALAALFAVLGHMFTCWLHFHGGKGVATGFGVFLVASPWAALAAIGVFAVVFALSRYVSVGSIVAAVAFMVFAWFFPPGPHPPVFLRGRVHHRPADHRQASYRISAACSRARKPASEQKKPA